MHLQRELELAKSLASTAGLLALKEQPHLVVTHKPDNHGPVSNADIAIDRLICDEIKKAFPNDTIISEESFDENSTRDFSGRTWFIDPIDGTQSYVDGHHHFAIMIGLCINGVPNLGVIFEPATNTMWYGIFDPSTTTHLAEKVKNNDPPMPIHLSHPLKSSHGVTLAISRHHRSKKQHDLIKVLKPKKIVYKSSVGLKAMLIIDSQADLYVTFSRRIKLWDTCAPAAILYAAGGIIQSLAGERLDFLRDITHGHALLMANFPPDLEMLRKLSSIA